MKDYVQQEISTAIYNILIKHIEDKLGATFSKIRKKRLGGIINDIAHKSGFKNINEYTNWLLETSELDHIEELARHLTIGESYFFRHRKTFDSLINKIIPDISSSGNSSLKIWCAGCSSGQEPYTIAIALNELQYFSKKHVNITGSDINNDFLDEARQAKYSKWSFRETSEYYQEKYFTKLSGDSHKLDEKMQKAVNFINVNLLSQDYPFNNLDVIFCRNVLIYFSQRQINSIKDRLLKTLRPGGWLITAPSEVPLIQDHSLELIQDNGIFFFRKRTVDMLNVETIPTFKPIINQNTQNNTAIEFNAIYDRSAKAKTWLESLESDKKSLDKTPKTESFKPIIELLKNGKYDGAIKKLSMISESQITPEYLELTTALADYGQFDAALMCLDNALVKDKLNPDIMYQKAVILNATNMHSQAKKNFEQVIFLAPDYIAAYFSLGTMLLKSDKKAANKKLEIAIKLSEKLHKDDVIKGTRNLTKEDLMMLVRNCCNHRGEYEC